VLADSVSRQIVSGPETYRVATRKDIPALSRLFREVFGIDREEKIWEWKLFSNPRGSASFLCEAEGRVVSHCAGVPVAFRDGANSYRALQSVDFMSSPAYSGGIGGGGVFVRTVRGFFDTFCGPGKAPLLYGFPGERHRMLGEQLLGYRSIEKVTEFSIPLESSQRVTDPDILRLSPITSESLEAFKSPDFSVGAERDISYLNWRYRDHPHRPYSLLTYRRWLGSPIVAIVRKRSEAIFVMELAGKIDRRNLEGLTAKMGSLGLPVKLWGSARHPIGLLLAAAGWNMEEKDHSIECRFFVEREVPLQGEMYYTLGDYDVQ